jgi:cytochrome b561
MPTNYPPPLQGRLSSSGDDRRYGAIAICLHWTIAALILTQISLGLYMNEVLPDHSAAQDRIQDIHVSVGLTTLLLILVRIGVRLTHSAPPLPQAMPAWERTLAHAAHVLFYVLMLALPLTGWALVSVRHEPFAFWGLHWPAIPGLGSLSKPDRRAVGQLLKQVHSQTLLWITLANLFLHVAGALKHQFDGHPVLWRMLPLIRSKPRGA